MKIFVGNLSWNTQEEGLRQAFEAFGEIDDLRINYDRETGRSRGFGFITFVNEDEALEAMAQMNDAMLDGRAIKVDRAKEREPRRDHANSGNRW